jgi:hypothetical protein
MVQTQMTMALLWREPWGCMNTSIAASPFENTLEMQRTSERYRHRMTKFLECSKC